VRDSRAIDADPEPVLERVPAGARGTADRRGPILPAGGWPSERAGERRDRGRRE